MRDKIVKLVCLVTFADCVLVWGFQFDFYLFAQYTLPTVAHTYVEPTCNDLANAFFYSFIVLCKPAFLFAGFKQEFFKFGFKVLLNTHLKVVQVYFLKWDRL